VVYLAILLKASPLFALVTLFFGVIQVILMLSATKHMLTLLKSNLEAQGRSQGYLTEALVQISTLKAAGAEKHVRLRWLRLFFAEMSASVRSSYFGSFVAAVQNVLHSLAPLVLLLLGAQQVISGSMQLGTMMALLSLSSSFLGPLISLVSTGQRIQQAQAHLERIVDVMKAEPEQKPQEYMSTPTPRLTGHIHLANVGFQYDKNAKHVLHNINLTIKPGQKVAIVGRSGSGKSTLGKLLLGLYLPTEGEIYYDNIPLRSMNLSEVRSQLGVVMQDIGLFNGSIRENIAFNTPGIDLTAVVWAAQAAAIHDDIMKMPMDYETIVSEGGGGISGGQRQRLALARALVRNPAILLLDEATSSLDVTTERVVERNLNSLSCTQIIIAHRLSTIRNADVILAVDQGTIVEQGTHDELLKHNGFYARLIADQIALGAIQENK
jgi:ABC-type bacteriocin/lantibiotic exporter with double-glycine peptidase domain